MPATDEQADRAAILQHIHSIFQAYLRKDRAALRATHSADWTGFQGPSMQIERSIVDYMVNAEKSLEALDGVGYEILDSIVQVSGDAATVFYTARYDYRDRAGRHGALPLRSIDLYRRERGEWIQSGSHISVIPGEGVWQAASQAEAPRPRTLSPDEQQALLTSRQAVWNAWFADDHEALLRVIPEEGIAGDPDAGDWASRDEILRRAAQFRASGARLVRLEFPQTHFQAYGSVVILYTRYELVTRSSDGAEHLLTGRATEVFIRRSEGWLNSGWQLDIDRE